MVFVEVHFQEYVIAYKIMEKLSSLRYFIYLLLVGALTWFTFTRVVKLLNEDAVISQQYVKAGAKLPSMTFCIKWFSSTDPKTKPQKNGSSIGLPDSENWSFEYYMKTGNVAQKIVQDASFLDQPHDRGG